MEHSLLYLRKYVCGFRLMVGFILLFNLSFAPANEELALFINCPSDIVSVNDPGECGAIISYPTPEGTGTGTNLNTFLTSGLPSGSFFPVGSTIVEYTVSNDEGETASCSFTVTINDNESPTFNCPDDLFFDALAGTCGTVIEFEEPEAFDNCPGFVVQQIGGSPSGSVFPVGENTVDFEVTDSAGNTGFCRMILVVNDVDDPVIECPEDLVYTIYNGCDTLITYPVPSGDDSCTATITNLTAGLGSGSSFPIGTSLEEYTVTDEDGNTASCSFSITVIDGTAPEITCPTNITLEVPAENCFMPVNYDIPTATDNCGVTTVSLSEGPASGENFTVGITTVQYTATDEAGNFSTCSFTVSLTENVAPEISCPGNIEVTSEAGECGATVAYTAPTGTDNCDGSTTSLTAGIGSGGFFPIGTTTEEYMVTDASGNTSVCSFTVTVEASDLPVITCPTDLIFDTDAGNCTAMATYSDPVASDNCGPVAVMQIAGPESGSDFPLGETEVTYSASNSAGTVTCSFTITVEDHEPPQIICPANIDIVLMDGACQEEVSYALPTATDNCTVAGINLIAGLESGGSFPIGVTTVSYEAVDNAGNSNECSFTVTVSESVSPEISCPPDITVPNDAGNCGAFVNYEAPEGSDNCSGESTSLTDGLGSGAFFPIGVTTEEYSVTDASGNTAVCSFTVTVEDMTAPELICPQNIVVSADDGACDAVVFYDLPEVLDNCGETLTPVLTDGLASGSTFPAGINTVTYQVTDAGGLTDTCSFTITIQDNIPPEIVCPANMQLILTQGICQQAVNYDLPEAIDNCSNGSLTLTAGPAPGEIFYAGTTEITYTAVDESGNEAQCSFTITLIETELPEIICPENIVANNDEGICGAIINYNVPTGFDNCTETTTELTDGLASGELFPVGETTVVYTATDLFGNTASCSFSVTVNDAEPPVIDCPQTVFLSTDDNSCELLYDFTPPVATDNCQGTITVNQTAGPASGSSLPLGETLFAFEFSDENGNSSTCSYTVSVADNSSPEFIDCPTDVEIPIGENCTASYSFDAPQAVDNCEVEVVQSTGPASGSEFGLGETTVAFTATDNVGNSSICSFVVTVVDEQPPVFEFCPEDFESCETQIFYDIPEVTDNCGIAGLELTEGIESGGIFPEGETTVVYTATDISGNTSQCSFVVNYNQLVPVSDAGEMQILCEDSVTTLTANDPSPSVGMWEVISGNGIIEDLNDPQSAVSNLSEGENLFSWTVSAQDLCPQTTDTVLVIMYTGVSVDAGQDRTIFSGGSVQLSAVSQPEGGNLLWHPATGLDCENCSSPVASPEQTTVYHVVFQASNGCTVRDSVTVSVSMQLPNTITPDGDGVNDVWNIPGIESFPGVEVQIFNRWGQSVFSSTGYREPWDGTFEGNDLPTGSYFYILDFKTGRTDNLNGTVSIIR